MKVRYLVLVIIMALVAVLSVSKPFCLAQTVMADASSQTEDGGDDGEYTEFA